MNGDDVRALLAAGDDLAEELRAAMLWIPFEGAGGRLTIFQKVDAWRKAAKAVRRDPYDDANPVASRRSDAS